MHVHISDPQGLVHCVEFSKNGVYGHENVAHGFEPPEFKHLFVQTLLAAIFKSPTKGELDGYTWEQTND